MNLDLDGMLRFWSDSPDFVFAGDGAILGGHEEWVEQLTKYNEETDRWLTWEFDNIQIEVLSSNAASCTLEFEYSKVTVSGETQRFRGAWTHVLRKYGEHWKVIQSNGTHIFY